MGQREIVGPQERFERSGAQRLRDIRPITTRMWSAMMSEFSSVLLAGGAMLMFVEPASVNFVTPASLLYAGLVMSRRVTLPLRLPRTARMRDWNHPSPKGRRPRMADGSIHLGKDVNGRELWIAFEDGRQHATVPGTTGAGKTTALLSFLANALTHASGFVIVDGKADNKLYGEVLALARRFGREDDVLCLNFMVASGVKDSNRFNPFAVGNADAIGEMLSSLLGEPAPGDANGVFRERAVALVGTLTPVLVWMRDHKGVPLNIETIRLSFELRSIWKVATKRVFEVRNPITGETTRHSRPRDARGSDLSAASLSRRTAFLRHEPRLEPAEDRGAVEAARLRPVLLHPHLPAARRLARPHLQGPAVGRRHARRGSQPPHPGREPPRPRKLGRTSGGAGQDRGRVAARHDGADARRASRGRFRCDRRQQARHGRSRPFMSSSTRSAITRRAAWTVCWPRAAAST